MQILALIQAADHVCYRYRIRPFVPALRDAGFAVAVVPLPHSVGGWRAVLGLAAEADIVIVQRTLLAPWYRWALRRAARRLVYDVDDAVFYRDSNSPKHPHSQQRWSRFRPLVAQADLVLAGNRFLVEKAAECAAGDYVKLLPTCVPAQNYVAAAAHLQPTARLVWIGSRSTLASLEDAQPCLSAAAERVPHCELRVVCNSFPSLGRVRVVERPWSEATETAELAEADIGVSWLPDHPWSLGKCGLKVLQYMAAGLPVVANRIGVHSDLIEHGRTGFLADAPDEWAEAVERLSSSPELRREMGSRARLSVARSYDATARAGEFAAAMRNLVEPHGATRRAA